MSSKKTILNSASVRKGKAVLQRIPRIIARISQTPDELQHRPPIIVNSLPKSGTHLLMQIAGALPGTRFYGSFIAQTPSLTMRERSQDKLNASISAIVPGEYLGAHLYHSTATAAAISERNALHLFIWRDPRDVIVSEAYYLYKMSRWHAMHKAFAAINDPHERMRLAILGNGSEQYKDASRRIGSYLSLSLIHI